MQRQQRDAMKLRPTMVPKRHRTDWLADERRLRCLKAGVRQWPGLQVAEARRSAEPDAAGARFCAAPAWEERSLPEAGAQKQQGLRQLRVDAPRLLEAAAMQASGDIALRVLLPACGPEWPSSHRRAWRCWRGRSWAWIPARLAKRPTMQASLHAPKIHGPSQPRLLRWSLNGSFLRPDPDFPEHRESVYS